MEGFSSGILSTIQIRIQTEGFSSGILSTIQIRIQTEGFSSGILLTIQIRIQTEGFSSGIWNVLLKWSTVSTIQIQIQMEGFSSGILSTIQIRIQTEGFSSGILSTLYESAFNNRRQSRFGFRRKAFHPVFCRQSRFGFRRKAFHPVFCRQSRFGFRRKAFHPVFCRQSRFGFRRKAFHPVFCRNPDSDEGLSSVFCQQSGFNGRLFIRYFVEIQFGFRWKAFHPVFDNPDSDSNIRYFVDNPDSDSDGRLFIRYLKCSTQMIDSVNNPDSDSDRRLSIRYFVDNPDSDGRLFIWYLKCSTQMSLVSTVSTIWINWGLIPIWIQTEGFSSGIWNVLLKWSTVSTIQIPDSDRRLPSESGIWIVDKWSSDQQSGFEISDGRLFNPVFCRQSPDSDPNLAFHQGIWNVLLKYQMKSLPSESESGLSTKYRILESLQTESESGLFTVGHLSRTCSNTGSKAFHLNPNQDCQQNTGWKAFRLNPNLDCQQNTGWKAFHLNPNLDCRQNTGWKAFHLIQTGRLFILVFEIQILDSNGLLTVLTIQIPDSDRRLSVWIRIWIVDKIPDEKPSNLNLESGLGFRRTGFSSKYRMKSLPSESESGLSEGFSIPDEKPSVWIRIRIVNKIPDEKPSVWIRIWIVDKIQYCSTSGFRHLSRTFQILDEKPSVWNVLLKWIVSTVSTIWINWIVYTSIIWVEHFRYWKAFHPVFGSNWSTVSTIQILDSDGRLFIRYFVDNPDSDSDGRLFIRYLKCSTQMIWIQSRFWIQTEGFSSGIWNVLLKWSTVSTIRIQIQTEGFSSGILSTIQIRIQTEGFSSGIWNVLLKWSFE